MAGLEWYRCDRSILQHHWILHCNFTYGRAWCHGGRSARSLKVKVVNVYQKILERDKDSNQKKDQQTANLRAMHGTSISRSWDDLVSGSSLLARFYPFAIDGHAAILTFGRDFQCKYFTTKSRIDESGFKNTMHRSSGQVACFQPLGHDDFASHRSHKGWKNCNKWEIDSPRNIS